MTKRKILGAMTVLFIIAAGCIYYYSTSENDKLTASGTIEVTKYDVTPRIAGYIRNLNCKEGDFLTAGEAVCELERDDLKRQSESSWQAVEAAQATLTDMQKGAREQEIFMAKSQIDKTKAVFDKAQNDLARNEQLYAVGGISRQELDSSREANDVAQEEYVLRRHEHVRTRFGGRQADVMPIAQEDGDDAYCRHVQQQKLSGLSLE